MNLVDFQIGDGKATVTSDNNPREWDILAQARSPGVILDESQSKRKKMRSKTVFIQVLVAFKGGAVVNSADRVCPVLRERANAQLGQQGRSKIYLQPVQATLTRIRMPSSR